MNRRNSLDRQAAAEWSYELCGEPLLVSAAIDRLARDAHQTVITGENYRTRDPAAHREKKPGTMRKREGERPR